MRPLDQIVGALVALAPPGKIGLERYEVWDDAEGRIIERTREATVPQTETRREIYLDFDGEKYRIIVERWLG